MVNQPYRISVIVPCFNHGEFVGEAVESVVGAAREDLELVVVDDGSTDERTRAEMSALCARGIKVIRQENRGLSAARNAGIDASHGELIFPLDADDRMRCGWIDRAKELLHLDPKLGVVYGDAEFFGTMGGRWRSGLFDPERLLRQNTIFASAIYRRSVWEQNGGYDERMLQGYEDWEFWVAAFERGWEFAYLPEVFFEYRKAAESMLTHAVSRKAEVEDFVAKKHGALYRRAWLRHATDHASIKQTSRRLAGLVLARAKSKCQALWRSGR